MSDTDDTSNERADEYGDVDDDDAYDESDESESDDETSDDTSS